MDRAAKRQQARSSCHPRPRGQLSTQQQRLAGVQAAVGSVGLIGSFAPPAPKSEMRPPAAQSAAPRGPSPAPRHARSRRRAPRPCGRFGRFGRPAPPPLHPCTCPRCRTGDMRNFGAAVGARQGAHRARLEAPSACRDVAARARRCPLRAQRARILLAACLSDGRARLNCRRTARCGALPPQSRHTSSGGRCGEAPARWGDGGAPSGALGRLLTATLSEAIYVVNGHVT